MKKYIILAVSVMAVVFMGCSNDDDTTRPNDPLKGFFPKTMVVTIGSGTSTGTFRYDYDDTNRIVSIKDNSDSSTLLSFTYNENGLVDRFVDNTESETYEITYDRNIITRIIETSSGTAINLSYNNGIYEFNSALIIFNTQNQLITAGSLIELIEYNTNPGPFATLDFQPIFFFLEDGFLSLLSYFFTKNEIVSVERSPEGLLTANTQRDSNGNITNVSFTDSSNQELLTYEITYEEREIIN